MERFNPRRIQEQKRAQRKMNKATRELVKKSKLPQKRQIIQIQER